MSIQNTSERKYFFVSILVFLYLTLNKLDNEIVIVDDKYHNPHPISEISSQDSYKKVGINPDFNSEENGYSTIQPFDVKIKLLDEYSNIHTDYISGSELKNIKFGKNVTVNFLCTSDNLCGCNILKTQRVYLLEILFDDLLNEIQAIHYLDEKK